MGHTFEFSVMLVSIFIILCHCEVYYVKPIDSPPDLVCPGNPCQTLNCYMKQADQTPLKPSNGTVTMILLEGYHKVLEKQAIDFGSPLESDNIQFKGTGLVENVIVEGLETGFHAYNVCVENITAVAFRLLSSLSSGSQEIITNISIFNCNFINSQIMLNDVALTIKDSTFSNCTSTAILLYSSTVTFMGHIKFFNNTGLRGGALALASTTMELVKYVNLQFIENYAKETGGAIFVSNFELLIRGYVPECFYQLMDFDDNAIYSLQFINNSARNGGDHIYGASLHSDCCAGFTNETSNNCINSYEVFKLFNFDPGYESTVLAVSADALSACICDTTGQPQCHQRIENLQAYPGGPFTLSVVVVGEDNGATTGTIYMGFLTDSFQSVSLGSPDEYHQVITTNSKCSEIKFSVYSRKSREMMFIRAKDVSLSSVKKYFNQHYNQSDKDDNESEYSDQNDENSDSYEHSYSASGKEDDSEDSQDYYEQSDCSAHEIDEESEQSDDGNILYYIDNESRYDPLFINITLLPCPPGFTLVGDPPGCDCHPVLSLNGINCVLKDMNAFHTWNTSKWVAAVGSNRVSFSTYCPFDYCKHGRKYLDLKNNQDGQCAFNHAGRLCGRCKESYSLAIGSSHCIHCPNNNNLALLVFFAAVGVLLVFIISALNLTVTQGTINGLIFYANIVWAYQSIIFPPEFENKLIVHKIFIAWLNLDFGIETCFISDMNAYLRTWLQFVFPFYTAGLFLLGLRYSSKLSKLIGNRSVPTLATVLFLSQSKLLRTIIACIQLVTLITVNETQSKTIVWALDGNLSYGHYPHIFLLIAATVCLILLWVPYTLFLFSMQWLRTVDHYGPLKYVARYKPVYDAYFAPLNDKHHYWFGVLLLVQGVLLLSFSLSSSTFPALNILLLLAFSILLLCYLNHMQTYKKVLLLLLESSFLVNLIVLAVGTLYLGNDGNRRMVLLSVSITAAFVEFCGIVTWNLIPQKVKSLSLRLKIFNSCCQWTKIIKSKCSRKYASLSIDHITTELEDLQIRIIEEQPDGHEDDQYIRF